MFGQIWNHGSIRKYVIYFGTLFADMYIQREDKTGKPIETMKVPLNYGPRDKFLARLQGNPDLQKPIALTLPRMAFEITNYQYDSSRKLTTVGKTALQNPISPNKKNYQYNPVPWDIEFTLYIMVKNAEDGTRIVEQILPFFAPEFTATLNVNPDMGVKYDVPLVLNSMQCEDTYEGNFETRRAIIWTLTFTMKAWFFGPTRNQSVITEANINFMTPTGSITITDNAKVMSEVHVTPGLTANGMPTSDPTLTIDRHLINSTDNYGFIHEFVENF